MKYATLITLAVVAWIAAWGSPFVDQLPEIGHHYGSPEPILPMTFAHLDHTTVGCIDCHHNYVDDTGGEPCMLCHVTHDDVWPLLEEQFHTFCRGGPPFAPSAARSSWQPRQNV